MRGHGDWALCHFQPLPSPAQPSPTPLCLPHAARGTTLPPTHRSFRPCFPIWIWWQTVRGRKAPNVSERVTLIPQVMEANRIESNRMVQNGIRPSKGRTTTCDAQAMTIVKPASRQPVIHAVSHITHPKLDNGKTALRPFPGRTSRHAYVCTPILVEMSQ